MSDRSRDRASGRRSLPRRRFVSATALSVATGSAAGCLDAIEDLAGPDRDGLDEGPLGGEERPAEGTPSSGVAPADEETLERERAIHDRVNEVRQSHDLDGLEYNEEIADVARGHSADMAERDYFAHESPEGEGPGDRMAAFLGDECRGIGENLAAVEPPEDPETTAERIVDGWMDSPGHRENLLREAFDEEGIGVVISADDRVLVTQKFCARRSSWMGVLSWPLGT